MIYIHIAGPSSAFEKWSGHEISKISDECRRHELGESTRGGCSPSRKGGSGDLPRENLIFPDVRRDDFNALWDKILPLKHCLFYRFHHDEAMSWSKTMKLKALIHRICLDEARNAEGI